MDQIKTTSPPSVVKPGSKAIATKGEGTNDREEEALLVIMALHTHSHSTKVCAYYVADSALRVFNKIYCGISGKS